MFRISNTFPGQVDKKEKKIVVDISTTNLYSLICNETKPNQIQKPH